MSANQQSQIVSLVWGIADDVLRDLYVRGKYRDVILPMIVLRRFDAVLEPTKQEVLEMKQLGRAMSEMLQDETELYKLYVDNPSFERWLSDTVFAQVNR